MNQVCTKRLVSVLAFLTTCIAQPTAAEMTISLRRRAAVESPVVRLGDMAEIISADRSEARRLAALPLMPAPAPGSERFLRNREVEDLLAAHGQDLGPLRVVGAPQVAIRTSAIPSNGTGTTSRHGATLRPIAADIKDNAFPVAVAVQPIARGSVITAADVQLQQASSAPQTTSRRTPITSLDELIGMEARQAIQPGTTIMSDYVQAPLLVKRGEIITVVSQAGGIRVRTTARAREDGALGELVQVETLKTRERYDARVTGPRAAAVFAAVRPTPAQASDAPNTWTEAKKMQLRKVSRRDAQTQR
jgi:flagella basal body P-ring formation protein FlgA